MELAPFTKTIDVLVDRLKTSLDRERRFTADAAHELRNPLAALRVELDLAGQDVGAAVRELHLQRSHVALDRMQRLVTQLLTLARVENLTELDDAGPVHLVTVAREVLRDLSERTAQRAIVLSLDHEGDDLVHGSHGLLGVLVQNLLDDALRHAREHGQVNVRIEGHTEWVTVEVNDDGTGFAAADLARVGERFHRPEGSQGEGSGLGLSIAHAIVSLHHGELKCGHSALGGAHVSFSLPRNIATTPH